MNKEQQLKRRNRVFVFLRSQSVWLCIVGGLISIGVHAQSPTVDLSTVPFYRQNFKRLIQIDSMQQDSNFIMTGYYKEPYRAMKIWGPRLYPHGDMGIAANAYSDYFTQFHSNQLSANTCTAYNAEWDYVGCNGLPDYLGKVSSAGRMNRLTFDPNYNNTTNRTIYGASFFGGLWRTEDNGEHWKVVNTDHQLPYTSVSDVAISPTNSNTIYISTGLGGADIVSYSSNYSAVNPIFSSGVYKSTDYGQNWSVMNSGLTSYINSDQGLFIRRMVISPFNENKMVAATSKGLFVCHNLNSIAPTWDLITSSINPNTTIDESDIQWRGIEFHPTNVNTIYASGKDVVRSTDGGLSWQPMTGVGTGLDINNIGGLASNMINAEVLRINIDVNPSDPNVLYAHLIIGYDKEIIKTTTDINTGEVTMDTSYFYTDNANTVYKFDGAAWEQLINVDDRGCNKLWMAIEADPVNIGTVYFSGVHVHRIVENPNGGLTNSTTISERLAGKYHDDTHDLEFPPIPNPDYLYSANHGGVAKKDINYLHNINGWESISNGIQTQLIWSFDENRFNNNKKAIALQDAGVVISYLDDTDTLRWRQLFKNNVYGSGAGDGYAVNIVDDAEDTYICQFNTFHKGFDIEFNPNGAPQFIVPFFDKDNFANHPHLPNATYGLDNPSNTYKFKNHSKTDKPIVGARNLYQMEQTIPDANDKYNNPNSDLWTVMSDITKQPGAFLIADWDYAPNDLNNIYVITQNYFTFPSYYNDEDLSVSWYSGGVLYKSTTGFCDGVFGDTTEFRFNYIQDNIVNSYGSAQGLLTPLPPITGLAVDPNNSDRLWLSFTGFEDNFKVLISEDGGDTWQNADSTGSLLNLPVNNLVYQQGTNDRLFIATDAGVYYKDAGMSCWEKFGDLPNVRVMEIQINPCNGKLSAATFGRGIWEVDLPAPGTIANTITITQNTIWTGDQYKYSNITIPNGVTLTVTGHVHMPYHSKIKVLKGGKLIVDGGTLTNNCGARWHGIEVEGDSDLNQFGNNQGKVELKNGARIEYAGLGVLLMTRADNGDVNWGTTGGLVKAENTTFYNCRRGVAFMAYDNISNSGSPLRNFSYFKDCTFEFNDDYKETFKTSIFPVGISMWGVDGIRIEGCTFKNEMTTIETNGHDKYDGHAIVVADASADIQPLMSNPSAGGTPQLIKRNRFSGFDLGIYSYGVDNTNVVVIRDNIFNDNKLGVYANQSTNLSIVENTFTVPHLGAVSEGYEVRAAGVYLKETHDFEVEENVFLGTNDGNNYDGGFVIEDLEGDNQSHNQQIFRNTFNDLGFAVLAYGNNGGEHQSVDGQQTWISGLEVKCNDFGQNTNNYQDLYIDTNASILPEQGEFGTSTENPAGNRFSPSPAASPYGHIFMAQGALEIDPYVWHGQSPETDPYLSDGDFVIRQYLAEVYNKPISCPPNMAQDDDGDLISDFENIESIIHQVSLLKTNYTNILNGGIREEIMELLLDDLSTSQQIRDELIQGSPYLDDKVLIAAITRQIPLNQWHLTEVLVWNSRLSRKVMQVLKQVQPLTPYQYNIVRNTDGNSQRYLLELEIRKREKELSQVKSDYILKAWSDESVNIYDEIIRLYNNDSEMDSQSKVIDAHLKKKDFVKSDALINAYIPMNSSDKFKTFYRLKSDLVKNGKNWFLMDKNEIRDLETIIDEDKYIVKAKAKNVRSLIQDELVTFKPKPVHLNLPQTKQVYIGKSDDGFDVNDIIEVSYIQNIKDLVFVNTSHKAQYILTNSIGQILLEGELSQEVTTLNVSYLQTGIYHIKIQTSDNNTCHETFVVR